MANKGNGYWAERMQALEDEQYRRSTAYYKDVQEQFRKASHNIQIDIEHWYMRLAENNDISYSAARKFLKKSELDEFKWTVEQYIKAGEENALDQRWMKELENASAKYHITRLEAMKLQMQQHAEVLFAEYEKRTADNLRKDYAEQYYRTAYEISNGCKVGFDLSRLDERRIDLLIKHPWARDGKNFSDRVWENKEKLLNNLHAELTQCIIRGESPRKAIDRLSKKMDVSKNQAGTLIMTESAAIASEAQRECFKDLEVEKFEFDATLDGKACSVCGGLDGKIFKMSEYEVGATAPPIHPRCRCCTVPAFDDWEEFGIGPQRAARETETDKTVYVDGSMKYEDWKKQEFGNGLAAGEKGHGRMERNKSPIELGKVDSADKSVVKSVLEELEKQIVDMPVENAVVVLKDGTVWQCVGELNGVYPNEDLGDMIKGSSVTHNHPIGSDNEYSFSSADIELFVDYDLDVLRGIDERYVYELNRNAEDIDEHMSLMDLMMSEGDTARHEQVIEIARKYGFGYRRRKRE